MRGDARLNLLLTPPPVPAYERGGGQPWHRTVSQLLVPLGVRTFEARSGAEAVELLERHPIHLAVVDTRLPAIGGLNVLQLIQRLHAQGQWPMRGTLKDARPAPQEPRRVPESGEVNPEANQEREGERFAIRMEVEARSADGRTERRIELRIDGRVEGKIQMGPVVILIAPPAGEQDKQLLQEALKFNAFSVLSEPVDVNVALAVMARAVTRCFAGLWPG